MKKFPLFSEIQKPPFRVKGHKYCDAALKVVQKGKTKFCIGQVEAIESTKDGSEMTSFQMKGKGHVRIRCSLYNYEENDI